HARVGVTGCGLCDPPRPPAPPFPFQSVARAAPQGATQEERTWECDAGADHPQLRMEVACGEGGDRGWTLWPGLALPFPCLPPLGRRPRSAPPRRAETPLWQACAIDRAACVAWLRCAYLS